jgi:hypothetical protein
MAFNVGKKVRQPEFAMRHAKRRKLGNFTFLAGFGKRLVGFYHLSY